MPFLKGKLDCPECGVLLDGATSVKKGEEKVVPHDGDFGICHFCSTILRYRGNEKDGLYFEKATEDDLRELGRKDIKLLEKLMKAKIFLGSPLTNPYYKKTPQTQRN